MSKYGIHNPNPVRCRVTEIPIVVPPPVKKDVTISMSYEHAVALMVVLNAVVGMPEGPRGLIDDLRAAMLSAGVPPSFGVHPVGKNGSESSLWLGR